MDVDALVARARALEGRSVRAIGDALGAATDRAAVHAKGAAGGILERALGATGGSRKAHDFPELGVELKTVPVGPRGAPLESTYVCTLHLAEVDALEWRTSWVRAKLARVLFVPLVGPHGAPWAERIVGAPVLWTPSAEEEATLRDDFEEIVGLLAVGRIEELTAHVGQALQVRPKARDGTPRAVAWAGDEPVPTVPRGFYLRARFTERVLARLGP